MCISNIIIVRDLFLNVLISEYLLFYINLSTRQSQLLKHWAKGKNGLPATAKFKYSVKMHRGIEVQKDWYFCG